MLRNQLDVNEKGIDILVTQLMGKYMICRMIRLGINFQTSS